MFELLFTRASAITRHQLAPLAEERRSFLRHLAQQSYRPRSLRSKASQLLAIVQQMNRVRGTSPAQIERATKNRRHLSRLILAESCVAASSHDFIALQLAGRLARLHPLCPPPRCSAAEMACGGRRHYRLLWTGSPRRAVSGADGQAQ